MCQKGLPIRRKLPDEVLRVRSTIGATLVYGPEPVFRYVSRCPAVLLERVCCASLLRRIGDVVVDEAASDEAIDLEELRVG